MAKKNVNELIAAAVKQVMNERSKQAAAAATTQRSAAVHTDDRKARYTREDLDLIALDNGASPEGIARRRSAYDADARKQFTEMRNAQRPANAPRAGKRALEFVSYMVASGLDNQRAYRLAKEHGADEVVTRALGESTLAAGGALVPEELASDYLELLYANTVYLKGNPLRATAVNGNITFPGMASGTAAQWIGENANVPSTDAAFRQVRADLKYIAAISPVSNRLLNHSPASVASMIEADLVAGASELIDSAAIRGLGTAYAPRGLRYQAQSANIFAQTGVTVAAISTDTAKMQRLILDFKIKLARPYWIMSNRSMMFLKSLRDGNNNLVYATEMNERGTFQGFPFGNTTLVPDNLGGGTNESELYLVDMAQQVYVEGAGADGLRVESQNGAAYYNGSSVVSGFSQDQTVIRMIQPVDVVSRQQGKEIAVLTGVTYGA